MYSRTNKYRIVKASVPKRYNVEEWVKLSYPDVYGWAVADGASQLFYWQAFLSVVFFRWLNRREEAWNKGEVVREWE